MSSLSTLIRPDLLDFSPYSSARDEARAGKIWLNANESPYAFRLEDGLLLNRYPDKQPVKLMALIASVYNIQPDQFVLSRGSDEAIDLLVRLFCQAGKDAIMICPPTFGMYTTCAQLQGADIIEVPLSKENNYQLDIDAIQATWDPAVKLIFLCSPNNPTGNLINAEDILFLCKTYSRQSIIVVDEAYIEFANTASLSNCIEQCDNLVVLRTFSKAFGAAGARCGMLISNQEIVSWILRIMMPYPLPVSTMYALQESMTPKRLNQIRMDINMVISERRRLMKAFKAISCIKKTWPSAANYILIEVDDAGQLMQLCLQNGIVIRDMSNKRGLENCVRISIGLPEENTQLLEVLRKV